MKWQKLSILTLIVSVALTGLTSVAIAADELEEVVVTGSRIPQNKNLISASPVTQVDAEEFLFTGITRVEDVLNDLPQVTGSNVANDSNGATGTASIDLRDLGIQRTLTLMNGRRLPFASPGAGGSGADINAIPSALIERVEVLTGGASAAYGSDAIAGVVNFIMKDDFEGVQLDLQSSIYNHKNENGAAQAAVNARGFDLPSGTVNDGRSDSFTIVLGANLDEGRGNVTAYANYRKTDAIRQANRDYSACALGGSTVTNDLGCFGSSTLPDGRFTDFGVLAPDSFDYIVEGDQFVPRDGKLYNFAPNNFFQRPDSRASFGAFANYDISDRVNVYGEFTFMDDDTGAQIAPSGAFFVTSSLNCDNPFLSAQQFQLLCGDFGLTPADSQTVFIGRRNVEGGNRISELRHTQYKAAVGVKGNIDDNWSFDIFGNFGRVNYNQSYQNDLSTRNITRALDAVADPVTGQPVCRSALSGIDPNCVPWNLFQTGGVTQDAIDYLVQPLFADGETELAQIVGYVAGDLTDNGIKIPMADDGVKIVAGFEYRKDSLSFRPDANYQSGDGAGQGGPTNPVSGSVSVDELFLEFDVPVTAGLGLGFGYRYSDYDTGKTTDTYKVTADWQFNDSFKARASFQSASRTANIRELFRSTGVGLFNAGNDPCANEASNGGAPSASLADCARSGVTAAQYGNIAASPAGQYNQLTGGNANLDPEESDTVSIGFVWTPEFVPGLDVTVDWFNIDVQGAVGGAGAQFLLNQCVNNGNFCDRINRNPLTGTLWVTPSEFVENTDANIGFQEREGIDISANYQFEIGDWGAMQLGYIASYVLTNDRQPVPGSAVVDCNGVWGGPCFQPNPEYRHNMRLSWAVTDALTASAAWRYHGEVEEDEGAGGIDDFSAQSYLDLSGMWKMNDNLGLRFGINNVMDKEPPISGNGANGNVEVTEYDVLGRYLFLGATLEF